jgi:flavin-dependent dehydrogenase
MSVLNKHKVIVIGGGPSGLISCFWLQRLGIQHLLIEKEHYPRDKACADILTSKAIRTLNEVDDSFIPELIAQGLLQPIYGSGLASSNLQRMTMKFNWLDNKENTPSCYSIRRSDFDTYLYKKVSAHPLTETLTGCQVSAIEINNDGCLVHTKDAATYETELVLVGTGANFNPLPKHLKLNQEDLHHAVGVRAYYTGLDFGSNYCELLLNERLMPGGFYVAPLENGLFNVNIVVRKDIVKRSKLNLTEEFENMIATNPVLKEKFKNAERVSSFSGSSLILGTKERTICGDRFMMIGDSAGLIDLLSANGIPQAMLSGKLSALQAKACLESQDFSASKMMSYQTTLFQAIKEDVSLGKFINPILGFKLSIKWVLFFVNFLSKSASKNTSLVKLIYHKNPVRLLFNPMFYFGLVKETFSPSK